MQRQNFITTHWPGTHMFLPCDEFVDSERIQDRVSGYTLFPKNVVGNPVLTLVTNGISCSSPDSGQTTEDAGTMANTAGAITSGNWLGIIVAYGDNNWNVGFGSWLSGTGLYFGYSHGIAIPESTLYLGDQNTPGGEESLEVNPHTEGLVYLAGYVEGIGTEGKMIRSNNGVISNTTDYTGIANIASFPGISKQGFWLSTGTDDPLYGFLSYNLGNKTLTLTEIEAIGQECKDRWSVGDKGMPELLRGI